MKRFYHDTPRVFRPHSSTNWNEIVPSIHEPTWYRLAKLVAGAVMAVTALWGVCVFWLGISGGM